MGTDPGTHFFNPCRPSDSNTDGLHKTSAGGVWVRGFGGAFWEGVKPIENGGQYISGLIREMKAVNQMSVSVWESV